MTQPTCQTELDTALEIARGDAKQANFFYDAFLNAEVLMPVQRGETPGEWKRLGDSDHFRPLFLNYEQTKVVPIFDRLERLQAWAGNLALDYIELKCHRLLGLFAPEVAMVLNLGTPWSYYFSPQILAQLRDAMRPVQPV